MQPHRITPNDLRRRLDAGERVVILDSRSADAWDKAATQIPGSLRVPPDDVEAHVNEIPRNGLIVPYCT